MSNQYQNLVFSTIIHQPAQTLPRITAKCNAFDCTNEKTTTKLKDEYNKIKTKHIMKKFKCEIIPNTKQNNTNDKITF